MSKRTTVTILMLFFLIITTTLIIANTKYRTKCEELAETKLYYNNAECYSVISDKTCVCTDTICNNGTCKKTQQEGFYIQDNT